MAKYNEYIMRDVRQNLGIKPDDTSQDEKIARMSKHEVFDRWLTWHNLIGGWASVILEGIEGIYGIDLEGNEEETEA